MKFFYLLLLFSLSFILKAQKIETVHVKDIDCTYDTVAVIKNLVDFKVEDEKNKKIIFVSGKSEILLVNLFTSECVCNDCSESFQIAVKVDSIIKNDIHYLTKEDVLWVYDNAWIEPKFITSYLGYIKYLGDFKYEIKISEMLNSTIIRSINLKITAIK